MEGQNGRLVTHPGAPEYRVEMMHELVDVHGKY
jgi:hypothetical protein